MMKIPTIYVRDWEGTLGPRGRLVTREEHPDCRWVFEGDGVATRKYDGTAVFVDDEGNIYKRLAVPEGRLKPDGFIPLDWEGDDGQRKLIGWTPVSEDKPADRWVLEAVAGAGGPLEQGSYELVGPKIQGNPEDYETHQLVRHADAQVLVAPTDYDELISYLDGGGIEGIVWHHPDGRMAKIKAKDFGVRRA